MDTISKITMEAADEIIQASAYADLVDDYEFDDSTGNHVYTLETGDAVVINADGMTLYSGA